MYLFLFDSVLTLHRHGSNCAGVIAAEGNNGQCGVGLAYNARIGGEINIQVIFEEKDIFFRRLSRQLKNLKNKTLYRWLIFNLFRHSSIRG